MMDAPIKLQEQGNVEVLKHSTNITASRSKHLALVPWRLAYLEGNPDVCVRPHGKGRLVCIWTGSGLIIHCLPFCHCGQGLGFVWTYFVIEECESRVLAHRLIAGKHSEFGI